MPRQNIYRLEILGLCAFLLIVAFMLLETRSITASALIHGATWFVNSVVLSSVLLMIFLANLYIARRPVNRPVIVYALLFASLLLNFFLPVESFLGSSWLVESVLSGIVMFSPILFAGIIFAGSFRNSKRPATRNTDFLFPDRMEAYPTLAQNLWDRLLSCRNNSQLVQMGILEQEDAHWSAEVEKRLETLDRRIPSPTKPLGNRFWSLH